MGNGRVYCYHNSAQNQAKTIQQTNYYPFGLPIQELSTNFEAAVGVEANNYQYNGIELVEDFGLQVNHAQFRTLNPQTGAWWQIDPMAEKFYEWSPYNFCLDNPLIFIDPKGDIVEFAGETEETAYNEYKNTVKKRVEAYDKKTQALRDKGKTERADNRDANRSDNVYIQIQGELNTAESVETVFRVRMGSNISNSSGGGNVSYNSSTKEIDVNIGTSGDWTTMQRFAHEFTHVDQFIKLELDLSPDGKGGLFYDKTDEVAAFQRQNLFGTAVDAKMFVDEKYSTLPEGPKSFHQLTPIEQKQYKTTKYIHNGKN